MIEDRLKGDDEAKRLLEEARTRLQGDPLRNALAAFYLQAGRAGSGSVEFAHKSFGEFLCAGRIKDSLADWAQPGIRRQEFYIPTEQMDWEIYDLLGFGGLATEIVEYITAYLDICSDLFDAEKIVRLFKRLEHFYLRWCDGEFIDAPPENLPQKKMRLLKEQLPDRDVQTGQRQIDAATGLNVLILLLELHHYANTNSNLRGKIIFFPCGQPDTPSFDNYRLLNIIGYSHCIHANSFNALLGRFFQDANLSGANIRGTFLRRSNFKDANLTNTFLRGTFFLESNLSGADFSGAKLMGIFLINADLSNANLDSADLSSADLRGANLENANLNGANLTNILWNGQTNWEGVRGLEAAKNVPEALKQQLENERLKRKNEKLGSADE